MKNDLTDFEKKILNNINDLNGTKYNYKHLMEWSTRKSDIEKSLKDGEVIYEALGVYVAIKSF